MNRARSGNPARLMPTPSIVIYPNEGGATQEEGVAVPEAPGIYCLRPRIGEPHVGTSQNLRRRVRRLLNAFGDRVASIECWTAASRLDSLLQLCEVTRAIYPNEYMRRLRLRPPWFSVLLESDPYPELTIQNRTGGPQEFVLGPFATRDAVQAYEEKVLALFQVRRCPGPLQPAAEHPGCVYGEMNQCLRPCQLAVSREEYASEVRRLRDFLETNGKHMLRTLSAAREQASERMDFEEAAQIHKRAEKVKAAAALREDIVGEIRSFCGVALTRGFEGNVCVLRPMWKGKWQASVAITVSIDNAERRSLDAEVREKLIQVLESTLTDRSVMDDLAIFQRWYRSSYRDGQWFPFRGLDDVDYRRIVKSISKLVTANAQAVPPAGIPC